jgi:adenylosuccinate synthase
LDVLSGLSKLKVCVGYRLRGKTVDSVPTDPSAFASAEPVYEELPGWNEDVSRARDLGDLPAEARDYIKFIGDLVDARVSLVSVGYERDAVIGVGTPVL